MFNWIIGRFDEVRYQAARRAEIKESQSKIGQAFDEQKETLLDWGIEEDLIDEAKQILLQDETGLERTDEQLGIMQEFGSQVSQNLLGFVPEESDYLDGYDDDDEFIF